VAFKKRVNSKMTETVNNEEGLQKAIITALDTFAKKEPGSWIKVEKTEEGEGRIISWDEYETMVKELASKINAPYRMGGFHADIIVGIIGSGLTTATLLAKYIGFYEIPLLVLFPDRHMSQADFESKELLVPNTFVIEALKSPEIHHILVVANITRTNATLQNALEYLEKHLPAGKVIKTALLIQDKNSSIKVDYCLKTEDTKRIAFPYELGA